MLNWQSLPKNIPHCYYKSMHISFHFAPSQTSKHVSLRLSVAPPWSGGSHHPNFGRWQEAIWATHPQASKSNRKATRLQVSSGEATTPQTSSCGEAATGGETTYLQTSHSWKATNLQAASSWEATTGREATSIHSSDCEATSSRETTTQKDATNLQLTTLWSPS